MYLQSILVVGGSSDSRLAKAREIAPKIMEFSPTGIDEVREIRRFIALGQSVILKDAHNLTDEAQNALLKTLEEPPENVHIVLLAQNIDFLLPTITSRCQIIELPTPDTVLTTEEQIELEKILSWIEESDFKNGFAWAKDHADRKNAIELIDKLLTTKPSRQLFEAKKYLLANTNVRLTLENLFLN